MILDYVRLQPKNKTHRIRRSFRQTCVTTSRVRIGFNNGVSQNNIEEMAETKQLPQQEQNDALTTGNVEKLFRFLSLAMLKHDLNNREALGLLQFYKYDLEMAVNELNAKDSLDMVIDVSWNLSGNRIETCRSTLPKSGIRRASSEEYVHMEFAEEEFIPSQVNLMKPMEHTTILGDDIRMKKLSFCWTDSTETEDILALYNMRHYSKESEALAELVVLKIAQRALKSKLSYRKFDRPTVLKVVTNATTLLNSGIYDSLEQEPVIDIPGRSLFGRNGAICRDEENRSCNEDENGTISYNRHHSFGSHLLSLEICGSRLDIRAGSN